MAGTRPGDNMANDVFNIIFSQAIGDIETEFKRLDIKWPDPPVQKTSSDQGTDDMDCTTSFVDDLASQAHCGNAEQVIPLLTSSSPAWPSTAWRSTSSLGNPLP